VWKDSDSLWSYALTKCHDYRAYNNLAEVRIHQERWAEAESLLMVSAKAENLTAHQSLGVLYYDLGRMDQALVETDRALEILSKQKPIPALSAELHFNRGAIFWAQGNVPVAIAEWQTTLRENPSHAQAREQLGIATHQQSQALERTP
jgi:tetratricopeptide (TPR) repeat protein